MRLYSEEYNVVGNLTSPVTNTVETKCRKFEWKMFLSNSDTGGINVYIRKEPDFRRRLILEIQSRNIQDEWMEANVTLTPGMYRIQFQNHPVVTGMGIKKIELHDGTCIKESKLLGQEKNSISMPLSLMFYTWQINHLYHLLSKFAYFQKSRKFLKYM